MLLTFWSWHEISMLVLNFSKIQNIKYISYQNTAPDTPSQILTTSPQLPNPQYTNVNFKIRSNSHADISALSAVLVAINILEIFPLKMLLMMISQHVQILKCQKMSTHFWQDKGDLRLSTGPNTAHARSFLVSLIKMALFLRHKLKSNNYTIYKNILAREYTSLCENSCPGLKVFSLQYTFAAPELHAVVCLLLRLYLLVCLQKVQAHGLVL